MSMRFPLTRTIGAASLALVLSTPAQAAPARYEADAVHVGRLVGKVDLNVDRSANGITIDVTGKDEWVRRANVRLDGDTVEITQDLPTWKDNNIHIGDDEQIRVRITAPPGTALTIGDMIGEAQVGDLDGDLTIDVGTAASLEIGRVRTARVNARGALSLDLEEVTDGLRADLSGASSVSVGNVRGPLDFAVNGLGSARIDRVDGPVSLRLNGVGSIHVNDGRADPLTIVTSGLGSVTFDGVAIAQTVSRSGFGSVTINGRSQN